MPTVLWLLNAQSLGVTEVASPTSDGSVGVWCVVYWWQMMGVQVLKGMDEEQTLASLLGPQSRLGLHLPCGELERMQ